MSAHVTDVPVAALPLDAVPTTLEYSTGAAATLHAARPALRMLNGVAVLSGLCVGTCFVVLASGRDVTAILLHLVVYAATLACAVVGGVRMARLDAPPLRSAVRPVLDGIAGFALLAIAFAPFYVGVRIFRDWQSGAMIGGAFLLMALTTYRHLLLYRGLADLVAAEGYRGSANWLRTLGWIKFIYEGLWLACCSAPLAMALPRPLLDQVGDGAIFVAFAAFFGCIGFAVVWVMMIVTHTRLVSMAARAASLPAGHVMGFDVMPTVPSIARPDAKPEVVQPPVGGPLRL